MADIARAGLDAESWAKEVHVDPAALQEVMAMFAGLDETAVREILIRHHNSVDASMSDLFALYESSKRKKRRREKIFF
jgi:hypothetical protein